MSSESKGFPIFKILAVAAIVLSLLGYKVSCESDKISINPKHGSGCYFKR